MRRRRTWVRMRRSMWRSEGGKVTRKRSKRINGYARTRITR
jgi:hypothetical protein